MGEIIQYEHHGRAVKVDESLKGKHREHCLCYRCLRFTIDPEAAVTPQDAEAQIAANCPKANELFNFVVRNGMVTPVYECPDFM